ncbi:hypothetical protein DOTSEDRAFT_26855 [Dothistroma septosporum NZE10]|uniref:Uncharacterized protein n=1 Tax=Dothistroma septosporum (strain NZE10 / CBS 128990) TaxID=675120 RepID=N1PHY4_DOTSN|nr:hypothetical protein DOTSEDRAFT_26855 [Dothistroma septosporum NZE10]
MTRTTAAICRRQTLAQGLLQDLSLITAVMIPESIDAASRSLGNIANARPIPSNIVIIAKDLLRAGLTADNAADLRSFVEGGLTGENNMMNFNPRIPRTSMYPFASSKDAPYSIPEAQLRGAIYIPPSFQYGKGAQPIILVPGTGNTGYVTFSGNYIPLLMNFDMLLIQFG